MNYVGDQLDIGHCAASFSLREDEYVTSPTVHASQGRPRRGTGFLCFAAALMGLVCGLESGAHAAQNADAPAGGPQLNCVSSRPRTSSGTPGSPAVEASFSGDDKAQTFKMGSSFAIRLDAALPSPDELDWQIKDYGGTTLSSGSLTLTAGTTVVELRCNSTRSGYFAVFAALKNSGATLPEKGSRPAGFGSFGVLPDYSHVLPAAPRGPLDRRRFGLQGTNFLDSGKCCDGNGLEPINELLGSSWALDARQQSKTEPKFSGEYNPSSYPLDVGFKGGSLARIVTLNGLPPWASTAPTPKSAGSYPPKSFSAFQAYTALVGQETESVRRKYIPDQQKNYYQVAWEPDPGPATHWVGSDADFTALYQAAWRGLHSTDPNAVVLGPTTSGFSSCAKWLDRLAPLGFAQFMDGVACHGYYTLGASSAKPPEPADLPGQVQALRKTMTRLLPAGTKLFITETGVSYPMGAKYSASFPTADVLTQHAEAIVRTHLIFLGEGADVTFLFYSADYSYEVGFGLYFNLSMPNPNFGSPNISPKPAAMAVAAMTRLIGDSRTLGALKGMPEGSYGYSFALPDRSHAITALWAHASSFDSRQDYQFQVDEPGSSGSVVVFDGMGNPNAHRYEDGKIQLTLSEMPVYVLSGNIDALMPRLRTPEGYRAE
jgi:hypothetical protein